MTDRRGTKVTFKPDPQIFETTTFSFDTLSQRLRELSFLNRGILITLEDERDNKKHRFQYEGGISSFVEHLNRNKETLPAKPVEIEGERDGVGGRDRPAVERRLRREHPLLREQHQHPRRRQPPRRLPRRPHPQPQRLRALRRAPQGRRGLRGRGHPRGPHRGHQRQGPEPAVRGPDQGQARQLRGQGHRGEPHERAALRLPRGEPPGGEADRRQDPRRLPGPRGRPQGPRPHPPEGRPRRGGAPRQARRVPGEEPREVRALPRGGRLGRRLGQAGPRPRLPGGAAAARQDPERREGPPRQDPLLGGDPQHHRRPRDGGGGRRLRRREAALPPHHHHVRRRRGRQPHPHAAPHVLLPADEGAHRAGPPLHRPAAALQGEAREGGDLPQGRARPRRLPPRAGGGEPQGAPRLRPGVRGGAPRPPGGEDGHGAEAPRAHREARGAARRSSELLPARAGEGRGGLHRQGAPPRAHQAAARDGGRGLPRVGRGARRLRHQAADGRATATPARCEVGDDFVASAEYRALYSAYEEIRRARPAAAHRGGRRRDDGRRAGTPSSPTSWPRARRA